MLDVNRLDLIVRVIYTRNSKGYYNVVVEIVIVIFGVK